MLIPDHIRCSAKPLHTAAAVKDYRVCVHALNAGICISKRPYFDDGHKLEQVLLRGGLLSTIERKLLDKHFGISSLGVPKQANIPYIPLGKKIH